MKTLTLLTTLILSSFAYSQDCPLIPISGPEKLLNDLDKMLNWSAASPSQIDSAACKTKRVPTAEEIAKYINDKADASKGVKSEKVNGVDLNNEPPALIEAFKKLTSGEKSFDFNTLKDVVKNQKDFQKEYKVNPDCKKVICALEKIWGKTQGPKMLYMLLKHNYNPSEFPFTNSDRFTEDELNDAVIGLEDLPPHLIPLGSDYDGLGQRLTHFKRGYTLAMYGDGSGVVANATVMLFDAWSKQSHADRAYTIFHEASHNIGSKLSKMDESSDWLKFSSWVKKGDKWSSKPDACFTSEYGKTNPFEDWAESLSSYRYNPNDLKTRCPDKYKFIKEKVFKNIEYTSTSLCSPLAQDKVNKVLDGLEKEIENSFTNAPVTAENLQATCKGSFNEYPLNEEELKTCSSKYLLSTFKQINDDTIKGLMAKAGIEPNTKNIDLIRSELEKVLQRPKLQEKTNQSKLKIQGMIEEEVQKQMQAALPTEFPKDYKDPDYVRWSVYFNMECQDAMVNGTKDELVKCVKAAISKEDRDSKSWGQAGVFPTFKAPLLFSQKAKASLDKEFANKQEEKIGELPEFKAALSFQRKKMKETLALYHSVDYHSFLGLSDKIHEQKGWRKMSPDEFCEKFYQKSFARWDKIDVDGQKQWCVKLQEEHKKRKRISNKDYQKWLDEKYPE